MKFVVVVVSALVSIVVCQPAAEAEPQQLQNQQRLSSFAEQFARNQAVSTAAASVPGRFSYEVNSVHPVQKPKQVDAFGVPSVEGNNAELNAQVDLPAVDAVPALRAAAPYYDRYAAYSPFDAYSLLSIPYYSYLNNYLPASTYTGYLPASTYTGYGGGYLNPFAYNPFGPRLSGPSAEE